MAGLLRESQSLDDDGDLNEEQRAALDTILKIAVQANDPALALDAMAILAGSRIAQANRLVAERLVADPALAARVWRARCGRRGRVVVIELNVDAAEPPTASSSISTGKLC